ncbi:uncharacterized protein LOC124366113 isoform X1 [Homalodisca vitripennis]|uniref:uncharacterized protein LOC124366113 isoform X1 n=1 Tax=Homalodisca vitripennis TaxID=197043 RepID=UPI001EEB61EE|nr:uncharacterized protein LOC124366113 isoform X1 [Homalodisca vitripennis]XP_046678362.1 uncharacterized protein LOC124366113 isoform X1 [Homalodisca vitripennis]XP_046678372.1 uncharacterized protein LOC124366113 isoform X1 [Homalodisca vitripennis]
MDDDIKLWKRRARSYQQSCCNSFCDRIYDRVNEEQLAFKVGYALYNAPTEIDEDTKTAVYTKAQESHIKLVCDKIKSLHPTGENSFYISYLYIVIRLRNKKNDEGIQVLFRIPTFEEGKPILDNHNFIDPKPRRYETWNDYLRKNKLPKCDMCYPVNGIYSAIDGSVEIQFGKSPACDTRTAVFTSLDVSSTVLLVGATGVTLVSLAVPVAAPFVWGATATVLASGTYDTARNFYRLHDIKKHGESLGLKNPDSRSAWLSLAGSVVGMASIGTTALAKGVVATESAISRAGLMTLRVLNVSSLAISGIGVVNGIITLVMKRINGTLETADILQFTSACLFFLNALVTYNLACRLIEELAFSDLTNLFNLRENASFRAIKDIMEFNDLTTYSVLRQLVVGIRSLLSPDIGIDDLESLALTVNSLLMKRSTGTISKDKFFVEMIIIIHKIWKRYENVILSVIEDVKNTFKVSYWQEIIPRQASTNLEIPRQMCKEVDWVIETCGISHHSNEHRNLMTFARAFATTYGLTTDQEFINRFKFYCDCIVAQFREERENYENDLDSQVSDKDFVRSDFDRSYGIEDDKYKFFFNKALDKVNHPDFLGNIDELYENLPRIEESHTHVPYLQTTKSKIYTFCGPLNEKELTNDYYWDKASDLSGIKTDSKNSVMNRKNDLVVIQPISNSEVVDSETNQLLAIVIHTTYLNYCHMGLLVVILK